MSSTTPVDSDSSSSAGVTGRTVDISSAAGGFIIAAAVQTTLVAGAASITGDETYTQRFNLSVGGGRHLVYDATGTAAATNTNTVVATFPDTNYTVLIAASWG